MGGRPCTDTFDLVVSNPPYVTTERARDRSIATCATSNPGARCSAAMTVSTRTGHCLRRCASTSRARGVMLEVDPRHADAVAAMFGAGFPGATTATLPDLTGRHPRRRGGDSRDARRRRARPFGAAASSRSPPTRSTGSPAIRRTPLRSSRIYAIKRRPRDLELTLLAASIGDSSRTSTSTPAPTSWPARTGREPSRSSAGCAAAAGRSLEAATTLSVRVPDHPLALELLRRTGPLATTSANRHGEPACRHRARRRRSARRTRSTSSSTAVAAAGLASTIIDCTTTTPRVLREGPITRRRVALASRGFSVNQHGGAEIAVTSTPVDIRPSAAKRRRIHRQARAAGDRS